MATCGTCGGAGGKMVYTQNKQGIQVASWKPCGPCKGRGQV